MPRLFAEQLRQRFVITLCIQHQQWRHAAIQIMLRDECLHDLVRRKIFGMFGEETLVAQMSPAAHHRQIYADQAILRVPGHKPFGLRQRDDVGIRRAAGGLDELLLLHGVQRTQLVAQRGGVFVMLSFSSMLHRRAQGLLDLLVPTLQQ